MNKTGIVLALAALAAVAGCKDPNWNRKSPGGDVKNVETTPVAADDTAATDVTGSTPAETTEIVVDERHCTCPPGTVHETPCACGASDCACVVVPAKKDPKPTQPVEEATTVYIVQRGDYLAKISKKYNVTINSIKRLNNLKDDKIRLGQKLKLPGKIDVGEQTVPEGAVAKPPARAKKSYTPYTGETKEYVVKSGDTLGAIAYGNGINIRQLKELNGLESDALKVGQKLKIPAAPVAKAQPKKAEQPAAVAKKVEEAKAAVDEAAAPVEEPKDAVAPVVDAPVADTAAEAVSASPTYTVLEGEDLTDIVIMFGVTASAVRELNNLPEDAKLVPGQVLVLPAGAQQQ